MSGEGEFAAWGSGGDPLPGSRSQVRRSPVAPPTLGIRLGLPVLLVTEPDSLRVLDNYWFGHAVGSDHEAYWAGPQGGPAGTASRVLVSGSASSVRAAEVDAFYTYPNPSRRECWIRVEGLEVDMTVHAYSASGTPLGELARFTASPGFTITREARWDVSGLAPGIYLLVGSLDGGAHRVTTTAVVIR